MSYNILNTIVLSAVSLLNIEIVSISRTESGLGSSHIVTGDPSFENVVFEPPVYDVPSLSD